MENKYLLRTKNKTGYLIFMIFSFIMCFFISCNNAIESKATEDCNTDTSDVLKTDEDYSNSDSLYIMHYYASINKDSIIEATQVLNQRSSLLYSSENSTYLFGKYRLNEDVTILDFKNNKVINTRTVGYDLSLPGAYESRTITMLDVKTGVDDRLIAFVGETGQTFEAFESKPVNNIMQCKQLDLKIKSEADFQIKDSAILNQLPGLEEIDFTDFKIKLLTYQDTYGYGMTGCKYVVCENGRIFNLTKPCSFREIYFYKYKDKYYIQTGSCGCGNGIAGYSLHEVTKDTLILEFTDYSYSN